MKTFDNLILCGRGGSGKSEFIDFLKNLSLSDRISKFKVGAFEEIDDFPWLHQIFKEEDIWEQLGRSRVLSSRTNNIYASEDNDIYKFLMLKFNQAIEDLLIKHPNIYDEKTIFIEFARGGPVGYKESLNLLNDNILSQAAIFYLDNTFEESRRRNTVRSNENDLNQGVLYHKVPPKTLEKMYKTHDFYELSDNKKEGYIEIRGHNIPFVSVWNLPESHDFNVLEGRYGPPLQRLGELYSIKE